MITIDQLLESVDLDFEPRWVTKDKIGTVWLWSTKPSRLETLWGNNTDERNSVGFLILSEFHNKPWTECIYEVPRKTTGSIERLKEASICKDGDVPSITSTVNVLNIIINRLNEVIDWINNNYKDFK